MCIKNPKEDEMKTLTSLRATTRNPFFKIPTRLLAVLATVMMMSSSAYAERTFAPRGTSFNGFGDVQVIGNTVLCLKNASGECKESPANTGNDAVDLQRAPRSQVVLTLPGDAVVQTARLYWQGRLTGSSWEAAETTSAKAIKFRKAGGAWNSLTADVIDTDTITSPAKIQIYSASKDVTALVQAGGAAKYEVDPSTFYTTVGDTTDGLGAYGAWVLVVVYASDSGTAQNVTIFDGFKKILGNGTSVEFGVSGFLAPKAGDVNSSIYVFAGEGDKYLSDTSDSISMKGELFNTTYKTLGTMDSRIDTAGDRNASLANNNGIDIQKHAVGTANGPTGKKIIQINETGAKFKFSSNQDVFFPSLVVFSTQLYIPELCYDYSVSQNDQFLPHDTSPEAHVHGDFLDTSAVTLQVMLRNKDGDSAAQNIKFKIADINATNEFEFYTVTGDLDLETTKPAGSIYQNATGDITEHTKQNLKFNWTPLSSNLKLNESVFSSLNLLPKKSGSLDTPLKMYVDFNYTIGAKTYGLTGLPLDTRVKRCLDEPSAYIPTPGVYNIVDKKANNGTFPVGSTTIKNNLFTQVANRPTALSVVSYDPSNYNKVKASNTVLSVEMIDMGGYYDVNASCQDPNTAISSRAWLPFGVNGTDVTNVDFNQSILGKDFNPLVVEADFYKNIRQNTAYRIAYHLDDSNASLSSKLSSGKYKLQNLLTGSGTGSGVGACGNGTSSVATACGTNGQGPAGAGMTPSEMRTCMECLYGKKTKIICSRDNFSIRPEAFNLEIRDPANGVKLPNDVALAAGYNYRFDINATNHVDANATPGYTASFFTSSSDRNATLTWAPNGQVVTGCNDVAPPALNFYFTGGKIINQDRNYSNVGRVELQIRDKLWTKVDHDTPVHHNNATNWYGSGDCVTGDDNVAVYNYNASSYTKNMVGCVISSQHTKQSTPKAQYNDYNLTFRPYKFDISNFVMGLGMTYGNTINTDALTPGVLTPSAPQWTYISDLNLSDKMGVRYSGSIMPKGKDGNTLSNFVDKCFAQPLDLNSSIEFPASYTTLNAANVPVSTTTHFDYRLNVADANTTDINNTASTIAAPTGAQTYKYLTLPTTAFLKDRNGISDINLTVNFDRNHTIPINPIIMKLNNLQFKCQTAGNCSSYADGITNNNPNRTLVSDVNVTFAYNRFVTRDVRVFGGGDFNTSGYHEVYNVTNFGALPASEIGGKPWYRNPAHIDTNVGDAIITYLNNTPSYISSVSDEGVEEYPLGGNTPPYNVRGHFNIEPWSWYRPDGKVFADPGFTDPHGMVPDTTVNDEDCYNHPCIRVVVLPAMGSSGSAKSGNESTKASKSTTSTSTWKSSSDYAPAIR
jgi:hypothetical protein